MRHSPPSKTRRRPAHVRSHRSAGPRHPPSPVRAVLVLAALVPVLLVSASASGQDPASDPRQPVSWPSPASVEAHVEEVEAFRAEREESLREPESWLTLAGLFWLQPGSNTLGSDESNDLVLPASAPPFVGELVHDEAGDTIFLPVAASGDVSAEVLVDGEPAPAERVLAHDADGAPSMVEAGDTVFYLIERRDQVAVRVKDRQSPTLRDFTGIDAYPVLWEWRIVGEYQPYDEVREVAIPSVLGGSDPAPVPGAVVFEKDGETYRLEALPGGDPNELFLVFGDETNGDTTYGGGRFVYADVQADDRSTRAPVVIDFNRAYNPPCVFTPWATCPLPPSSNRLDLRIEAGEKMYGPKH